MVTGQIRSRSVSEVFFSFASRASPKKCTLPIYVWFTSTPTLNISNNYRIKDALEHL